jgi:thioredoxin
MTIHNPLLEQLNGETHPIILDFWAAWCLPCRFMNPAIKRLEQQYDGKVEVRRVNVDEHPEWAREMGVYGIPTLILLREGQERSRLVGSQPAGKLEGLFAAASGETLQIQSGLRSGERFLRAGAGLAVLGIGWFSNPGWPFVMLGGVLLFSAVYDRCPVWQAVRARMKQILNPAD